MITPAHDDRSWQFCEKTGFDVARFEIGWKNKQATYPMGKVSSSWTPCPPRQGYEVIYIKFRAFDWRECIAKSACTKAQRRTIAVQTQEIHDFLKQKRAFQETQDFRDLYRQRASVEGTISQAGWVLEMRRSRYQRIEKRDLQNILTATAINLIRVMNWLTDQPLARMRTSRFVTLIA